MNELRGAKAFLVQTLSADPQLSALVGNRVYADLGEEGAPAPYVLFSSRPMNDASATGGVRIMARAQFVVRAVTINTDTSDGQAEAETIANHIDRLLQGVRNAPVAIGPDNFTILSVVRDQPVDFVENSNGRRYNHVGGLYRFNIQGA